MIDKAEEATFIRECAKWPNYPLLPVKKYEDDGDLTVGIVLASQPSVVYLTNLWDLHPGPILEQLQSKEVLEFPTIEALVEAGWIGD